MVLAVRDILLLHPLFSLAGNHYRVQADCPFRNLAGIPLPLTEREAGTTLTGVGFYRNGLIEGICTSPLMESAGGRKRVSPHVQWFPSGVQAMKILQGEAHASDTLCM